MKKRKIRDEADARSCLKAAAKSKLGFGAWARAAGVDGRSLRAWSINLERGAASRHTRGAGGALTKRVELVELVPSAPVRAATRYVVHAGRHCVEVDADFDTATLRRLVEVLASC